jgi:hypothetical protein
MAKACIKRSDKKPSVPRKKVKQKKQSRESDNPTREARHIILSKQ